MEFLKEIIGEDLYKQIEEKINAHNGNEANKEKQIKIGNLGSGEYVGKGKHDSEVERLNTLLSGKENDIQTLNATLESLKKGKVDADTIQQKLDAANRLLNESKAREAEIKLNYALRDALRSAKAMDVDYLSFKLNEKLKGEGKAVELDENEHIKGWDDMLSGLKTQFPNQFEKAANPKIDPNPLPNGDDHKTSPTSLADALRMQYENK